MIDPGRCWRWNQPPAECGVVKNNSCSAVIFTPSPCAQSQWGEEGNSCFSAAPAKRGTVRTREELAFFTPGVLELPFCLGPPPRKGFRPGFARKTKLTPVTFPHECMHRRALSLSLPSLLEFQQDGRRGCLVSACSVCVLISAAGVCCPCVPPACSLSGFCPWWSLSLVSVPSPVHMVLQGCRNQPFPPSSAAESPTSAL